MNTLHTLVTLFLALNLILIECGLYAIFGAPKQKTLGLILLASAGLGLALLGVGVSRLSGLLFGKQIIAVDLVSLVINPPIIPALLLVIFLTTVVWQLGYAKLWQALVSVAVMLGLVGLELGVFARSVSTLGYPALVALAIGLIAVKALDSRPRWVLALPVITLGVLGLMLFNSNQPPPIPDPQLAKDLPAGFKLSLYRQLTELPTALTTDPDGNLYVTTTSGNVLKLVDADGDGTVDNQTQFASGLGQPLGIVWYQNQVFISANTGGQQSSGRIVKAVDSNGDGVADTLNDLVTGLPSGYYPLHQNNNLALGPDHRLYLGVGSTSDHDPETVQWAASIISFNLDGSDLRTFATGLRNPYGLAFSAEGQLFATDNAPDQLNYSLPSVPPDELNLIVEGGDYGFPHYFGNTPSDSKTRPPLVAFTMETVPTGLVVYSGSQFPAEYRGNVFVALWQAGPEMDGGLPRRGLRIARITLSGSGNAVQAVDHDFITGLQGPIGVTVGKAGELYVADMIARRIYRVTYTP